MSRVRPIAVIPAYNAEARIGATIDELAGFVSSVIVVDDGSQDFTAKEAAARAQTQVIRQARRGPGAAVLKGLRAARDAGAEFAVIVDADGQMDASKIPELLEPLTADRADLVRGDRLRPDSGGDAMPVLRRFAARLKVQVAKEETPASRHTWQHLGRRGRRPGTPKGFEGGLVR